jgi:hypothetical protein
MPFSADHRASLACLTKNPRLTGNRGSSEILCCVLEAPSHDASAASAAMPHGRLSIDTLCAQANIRLNTHFRAY